MEVVYYYDDDLGYCPVKKYLDQYNINNNASNRKTVVDINAKIDYLIQINGVPIQPIAKRLKGCSFFEINRLRKNKNTLIRIFYFCYDDKIVLLNAIEKPSNYNTNDKDDRKIKKELKITEEYQNKFKLSPKLYEKRC